MDGAELVLDAFGLAFGQRATGTNHINTNVLRRTIDDIENADEVAFWLFGVQNRRLVIRAACQLMHLDVDRQEVGLVDDKALDIFLHVTARQNVLLVIHNSQSRLGAKLYLVKALVEDEDALLHVVEQVEVVFLL